VGRRLAAGSTNESLFRLASASNKASPSSLTTKVVLATDAAESDINET